jgi:putative dehydrogenase
MTRPVVGILAPGEMGHAVGAMLRGGGVRVLTNLAGRSAASVERARVAGLEAVADDEALVRGSDLFLSIVPPAEALPLARRIAAAARNTGVKPLYVDCNAISPASAREIGAILGQAGLPYVDAGIVGPPPRPQETKTRFYASGNEAPRFAALGQYGLDIRVLDGGIGAASGLKMCYAALSKGTWALATQVVVTAAQLKVTEALRAEWALSRKWVIEEVDRLPQVPSKAYRWVAEMEEIAATFATAGFSPDMFNAAAELFQTVADARLTEVRSAEAYAEKLDAALNPAARRPSAAD